MAGRPSTLAIRVTSDSRQARQDFAALPVQVTTSLSKVKAAGIGAALVVGAGIAKAITGSFSQALEQGKISARLAAQLDATGPEAAKYGKVAGKLFAGTMAGDFQQGADAIRGVMSAGLAPPGATEDQLKSISTKVLDLANTFDTDLTRATDAAATMLRTGLVKNADEAFDTLTRGYQVMGPKAEDLLDTFIEYPVQFQRMGLDAKTTFGMIQQGLNAGARNTDLMADAIKEFTIEAVQGSDKTRDGWQKAGLNADKMFGKIKKGGKDATEVFGDTVDALRKMEDPIKRDEAAVDLFGTKSEDLQKALLAMDPATAVAALGDVGGAATRMGDKLRDNASSRIEAFQRTAQQVLVEFVGGTVLPGLERASSFVSRTFGPAWEKISSLWTTQLAPAAKDLASAIGQKALPPLKAMATWCAEHVLPAVKDVGVWVRDTLAPALRDLGEKVGEKVLPPLREMGLWCAEHLVPPLKELGAWVRDTLAPKLGELATTVVEDLMPGLVDFGEWIVKTAEDWAPLIAAVATFTAVGLAPMIASMTVAAVQAGLLTLATGAQSVAMGIASVATGAWSVAMGVLNAVMRMNPILMVVSAVAALAVGFYVAYQKSETFRNTVQTVWEWCKKLGGYIADFFVAAFNKTKDAIGWVIDKLSTFNDWLGRIKVPNPLNLLKGAFDEVKTAIGWVIDKVESLIGWLGKIKFPSMPGWLKSAGSWVGGLFSADSADAGTRAARAMAAGTRAARQVLAPRMAVQPVTNVTVVIDGEPFQGRVTRSVRTALLADGARLAAGGWA